MKTIQRATLLWLLLCFLGLESGARPTRKLAFFIACDSRNAAQCQVRESMLVRFKAFRSEHDISRYALPVLTYYLDDPTTAAWCQHLGLRLADAPLVGLGQARRNVVVRVARCVARVHSEDVESAFEFVVDLQRRVGPPTPPTLPRIPLPRPLPQF